MSTQDVSIDIKGMNCGGCVGSVKRILVKFDGLAVKNVEIGKARFNYDPSNTSIEAILEALGKAGFESSKA